MGYAVAPPEVSPAIRKTHACLTVGAAAPLQHACITALRFGDDYYRSLRDHYLVRRNRLLAALEDAGFHCYKPYGAYYILTDISGFGFSDDIEFTRHLIEKIGIAAVPGTIMPSASANAAPSSA